MRPAVWAVGLSTVCTAQDLFLSERGVGPSASKRAPPPGFVVLDPVDFAEVLDDDLAWATETIPFVEVDDADLQLAYYFRWRSYKLHLQHVTDAPESGSWVVSEFLPQVGWSGKDNTISCAAGHHFMEGRWMTNSSYLDSYAKFWFRSGGSPRLYTFWAASSIYQRFLVTGDEGLLLDLYPDLADNYAQWKSSHYSSEHACMWQFADRDGQENSIGGDGCRPVLNSVMFGEAKALASIAALAGDFESQHKYEAEAEQWRSVVLDKLWSEDLGFFATLNVPQPNSVGRKLSSAPDNYAQFDKNTFCCDQSPCSGGHSSFLFQGQVPEAECFARCDDFPGGRCHYVTSSANGYCMIAEHCDTSNAFAAGPATTWKRSGVTPTPRPGPPAPAPVSQCRPASGELAGVREIQGLSSPWYFGVPAVSTASKYTGAWDQLFDQAGLAAKWGPLTAERRSPCYNYSVNHECNWNGPSWPFETSKVISAAANLLNDYPDAGGHLDAARYVELLQQYARAHTRMTAVNSEPWKMKGAEQCWIGEDFHPNEGYWLARKIMYDKGDSTKDRGNNYNHSTFCDLVLSGLLGLRPGPFRKLIVNPLMPKGKFRYFAADGLQIKGRRVAIAYDADGSRYGKGSGLRVWVDGQLAASSDKLEKLTVEL